MKIETAPCLPDEPLSKFHAALFIRLEERLYVPHFYRRQDQGFLLGSQSGERRLGVHKSQMNAGMVA